MKKIFIYGAIMFGVCSFTSCDDNISDEQFTKMVLLTKNGVQDYNIEFTDKGQADLYLPISVNGTSVNNRDVVVRLAEDPDTLTDYNFERFRNRTALYYKMPSNKTYSFPAGPEITIKSGSDYAVFPLALNLNELDLYSNYVLPLKIESVSTYQMAWNQYTKLLMRLNISNLFSGNYNVDGKVWEESYPAQKLPISSTVLRALAADQCYLYAGNVTENDEDRSEYSLTVKINKDKYEDSVNDETNAQIRKYTDVTIGSKNTDKSIKDESNGNSWVEISRTADPINNNLENVMTKVYLRYSYLNLRNAGYPVKMIFEGTLSHSESIDIRKDEGTISN